MAQRIKAEPSDGPAEPARKLRRPASRWVKRLLTVALTVAIIAGLLVTGAALFARQRANDGAIAVVDSLAPDGQPASVLAVFAHPDDEIAMAGTIARFDQDGVNVTAIYLTRGQAAKTRPEGMSDDDLGALREGEARAAAEVLGIDTVLVLDHADGGLEQVDPADLQDDIGEVIADYQPSIVLTYDDAVGLYGHPDHRATSQAVQNAITAAVAEGGNPVQKLYVATLPEQMIDVALRVSQTFADNYPEDPAAGLPDPTVAVRVSSQAAAKYAALTAHESQAAVLGDVQPGIRYVPAWLYYRIFDREYFAELPVNDLAPPTG